jgi:hypothetical protein
MVGTVSLSVREIYRQADFQRKYAIFDEAPSLTIKRKGSTNGTRKAPPGERRKEHQNLRDRLFYPLSRYIQERMMNNQPMVKPPSG